MKNKNIPNIITCFRIVIVPFLVYAIIMKLKMTAIALFSIAAMTDAFDGYLARKWKVTSRLVAMIDSMADKV